MNPTKRKDPGAPGVFLSPERIVYNKRAVTLAICNRHRVFDRFLERRGRRKPDPRQADDAFDCRLFEDPGSIRRSIYFPGNTQNRLSAVLILELTDKNVNAWCSLRRVNTNVGGIERVRAPLANKNKN